MSIVYQPKILLLLFSLIFFIIYLFYLTGEKKYKKDTVQTIAYFSGKTPYQNIKLQNVYWGFFKNFEKLYLFLSKIQRENTNDYVFMFIIWLTFILLTICLI